jgi:hypothetical protein
LWLAWAYYEWANELSVLQLDSFDGYVTSEVGSYWTDLAFFGAADISSLSRTGVGAMNPRPGGVARNIGTLLIDAIIGFAFMTNSVSSSMVLFSQGINGPGQCELVLLPDSTVGIQLPGGVTILASSSPTGPLITPGVYHYVEWLVGFTPTSLNQVWIDGQLVLSAILNTQAAPTSGASTVNLLGPGGGFQNYFDDYYLVDPDDGTNLTTAAGDSSVICSISSSNCLINQWEAFPSTNANWVNVHEIPADDDVTYNFSPPFSGQKETYQVLPNLAITDVIHAVLLTEITRATGGETARPYLIVNGTEFNHSADNYTPGSSYSPATRMYEREPTTTGLWSPNDYNSTCWGITNP